MSLFTTTHNDTLKRKLSLWFVVTLVLTVTIFLGCGAWLFFSHGLSPLSAAVFGGLLALWVLVYTLSYRRIITPLFRAYGQITACTNKMALGNLDAAGDITEQEYLAELSQNIATLSSSLNDYIYEISAVLSHLSVGDMAVKLSKSQQYSGDFMPIKNALKRIILSLNETFSEISLLVDRLTKVSKQLKNSAGSLAQGSAEQLQEIANLSELVTGISHHTADNASNAQLAAKSAMEAKERATTGDTYMSHLLVSMDEIGAASNDISTIIKLIDSIAFQTNVLALNASVEAARAGAAGKGFAVVANEVKQLALKSADAAKQTEELIYTSIQKVQEGVKTAEQTAEVFKDIRSSVDITAELSGKIASLSQAQARDITRTTGIISGISGVVDTNAANAQEVAAVSEELNNQAKSLKRLMKRFQLKGSRDASLDAAIQAKLAASARTLMQRLKEVLSGCSASGYDALLKNAVNSVPSIECLYLIDEKGIQLSSTVMSDAASKDVSEEFKPAMPGDCHAAKKYFTKALKLGGEVYQSEEYISGATGGLCRTFSALCTAGEIRLVVCIDTMCGIDVN